MTDQSKDKLEPLRLLAAKQRLGLLLSENIPPICDQLLNDGVYSPSLAELALNPAPIMSDVVTMLEKALKELGISPILCEEALWKVATDLAERLSVDDAPLSVLEESASVVRSEHFSGSLKSIGPYINARPHDFIWYCDCRSWDDQVDFLVPGGFQSDQERWEYIRPEVQQAARNWLAGKSIRE